MWIWNHESNVNLFSILFAHAVSSYIWQISMGFSRHFVYKRHIHEHIFRSLSHLHTQIKQNGAHSRLYGSFECFELISDNTKMWMNRFIARYTFFFLSFYIRIFELVSLCFLCWSRFLLERVHELPRNGAMGGFY